jgi:hypothetical protein
VSCEIPFHEGQTCEEHLDAEKEKAAQEEKEQARQLAEEARQIAQVANEQKSVKVVQETSKNCPFPSCGVKIHRVDGCDHMTCKFVLAFWARNTLC